MISSAGHFGSFVRPGVGSSPRRSGEPSHSRLYRLRTYLRKHLVSAAPAHSHILLSANMKIIPLPFSFEGMFVYISII